MAQTPTYKALVVTGATYPALFIDQNELREIMTANAGEAGFRALDLDRIKIPSGGATVWEVPTMEGTDATKEFTGIIVEWNDSRNYWQKSMEETGGNTPPDCYSDDMEIGIGMPGGECRVCPLNQFGTAERGEGKACREVRNLFVLLPGRNLPVVLGGAPSSIKNLKQYLLRLSSNGYPYYGVLTKFSLEKVTSPVTHSRVVPAFAQALDPDTKARAKAFGDAIRATFQRSRA